MPDLDNCLIGQGQLRILRNMQEPLIFDSQNGHKLFGIVHPAECTTGSSKKQGIVLLDPGIKYRVAPHRLNIKIARKLAAIGFPIIRFDPHGIGDSEGELLENAMVYEIWGKIQTGIFVSDTVMANRVIAERCGVKELVLIGTCGGAITALLTAAEDRNVRRLCLIDIPLTLATRDMSFADVVTEGSRKADWLFSEYIRRVFSMKSWYRLVTMKSDFRGIRIVLALKLRKLLGSSQKKGVGEENIERICSEKGLNRLFFSSLEKFISRGGDVLFIIAGNGPEGGAFQQHLRNGFYKERFNELVHKGNIELLFVEGSNHIYSLEAWQNALLEKVLMWVKKN